MAGHCSHGGAAVQPHMHTHSTALLMHSSSSGNHVFELTTFDEACLCDACNKLLYGCYFQGYYCQGAMPPSSCGAPCAMCFLSHAQSAREVLTKTASRMLEIAQPCNLLVGHTNLLAIPGWVEVSIPSPQHSLPSDALWAPDTVLVLTSQRALLQASIAGEPL